MTVQQQNIECDNKKSLFLRPKNKRKKLIKQPIKAMTAIEKWDNLFTPDKNYNAN
jgi:hypothetical protein